MDYNTLVSILNANKDKDFVQRILDPSKYPTLDLGNGYSATHKMSWGTKDGKAVVFPTVLHENGKLIDYGDDAFDKAIKTNQFISFDSPEEADWFSKNYKQYWDVTGQINAMNKSGW